MGAFRLFYFKYFFPVKSFFLTKISTYNREREKNKEVNERKQKQFVDNKQK